MSQANLINIPLKDAVELVRKLTGSKDPAGELLAALKTGSISALGNRYREDICQHLHDDMVGSWGELTPDWWSMFDVVIDWDNSQLFNNNIPPMKGLPWTYPNTVAAEKIVLPSEQIEAIWGSQKNHNSAGSNEVKSKPKRGAPELYHWEDFWIEISKRANTPDGLPEKQSELTEQMLEWCGKYWGKEPGLTSVRDRIRKLYQRLQ